MSIEILLTAAELMKKLNVDRWQVPVNRRRRRKRIFVY